MVLNDTDASIQKGVKDSNSQLTAIHDDADASILERMKESNLQ